MTRALEIVLTPLIFGGAGYLLDRWLGTEPVLMLMLGIYAIVGVFVRMWWGYDREMKAHEKALAGRGPRVPRIERSAEEAA